MAFDISKKIATICPDSFRVVAKSLIVSTNCVSYDVPLRYQSAGVVGNYTEIGVAVHLFI